MSAPEGHSPLGGSGAKRWIACPGSVNLAASLVGLPECAEDESEYAAEGTCAHVVLEKSFNERKEPWQYIGQRLYEPWPNPVDSAMAQHVWECASDFDRAHPDQNQGNTWAERRFHAIRIHPQMYGTSDRVYFDEANRTLHIWDFKYGAGIIVEATGNEQGRYYCIGTLYDLFGDPEYWSGSVDKVVVHIHQPRTWRSDHHRFEELTIQELVDWLSDVLLPAMSKTETSDELISGEHCRFCPARFGCPQMWDDVKELFEMVKKAPEYKDDKEARKGGVPGFSNEQVGRFLELFPLAQIAHKAVLKTGMMRLNHGTEIPGIKLVNASSNRVWRNKKAEQAVIDHFGDDAYAPIEIKTPAQIEKMPGGKEIATEHAFKPDKGLTVALDGDARRMVSRDTKSLFTPRKRSKR